MKELDLASRSRSADMPYLHGNQPLSVGHEATLSPVAGKGKLSALEGFMQRHKSNPHRRPGKFLLSSNTMSESVLKDFLS